MGAKKKEIIKKAAVGAGIVVTIATAIYLVRSGKGAKIVESIKERLNSGFKKECINELKENYDVVNKLIAASDKARFTLIPKDVTKPIEQLIIDNKTGEKITRTFER